MARHDNIKITHAKKKLITTPNSTIRLGTKSRYLTPLIALVNQIISIIVLPIVSVMKTTKLQC
jgi:hypothetical protein